MSPGRTGLAQAITETTSNFTIETPQNKRAMARTRCKMRSDSGHRGVGRLRLGQLLDRRALNDATVASPVSGKRNLPLDPLVLRRTADDEVAHFANHHAFLDVAVQHGHSAIEEVDLRTL